MQQPPARPRDSWPLLALALLTFVVVTVGPMALVEGIYADAPRRGVGVSAVTAALGAVFRASARNIFRSTVMTTARAAARTMSRRLARAVLGPLLLRISPNHSIRGIQTGRQPAWLAVTLALLALGGSFAVVGARLPGDVRALLLPGSALPMMVVGALLPLPCYVGLLSFWSRRNGVDFRFVTRFDGLLLQAYFTVSGSFLPLTSDAELRGDPGGVARTAGATLLCLLVFSIGLSALDARFALPWLGYSASMMLLYAFVFSFPLRPLDGGDIFVHSKVGWFVVWALVLSTFILRFPEVLYAIL